MTRHLRGWLKCEVCDETAQAEFVVGGESTYPLNPPTGWAVAGLLYPRDLCPRCVAIVRPLPYGQHLGLRPQDAGFRFAVILLVALFAALLAWSLRS